MTPEQILARRAWRQMALRDEEYHRLVEMLGRHPNWTELGMFAVLWSEHCAYKHSRLHLGQLPTEAEWVLVGPGENAGVLDVGEEMAVAFRIESHNHPIAVEPYQGAATGVGGIIRDVLAMGARPIALLDSLRFGPPEEPRCRYTFAGVVSGIAGYGNCVGVPTVGGELYFEEPYRHNPLCNVMCIGILPRSRLRRARAAGIGNSVILVGSRTGRDGIHGATFASEELDERSEERRPAVQVGDPFTEKLLIEACLELVERELVVGIQDMGAAGITSSCAETAARAGTGMRIDLDRVPLREEGMTPYEIMLSESQERMLIIAPRGKEEAVLEVCRRWGLEGAVIGEVTGDGHLKVFWRGELVADVPVKALAAGAPVYDAPASPPSDLEQRWRVPSLPEPTDCGEVLKLLLRSPSLAHKSWVWEQYDHMVQVNTVVLPGADAAVLRLKGTRKGIAASCDGNGRYTYLDPYRGAVLAVAEACRNVSCVGARPLGITNCLNFGNPEKPDVMWSFREVVRGMADACRALGVPVTGGNVSFYNESPAGPVYPTPVVGAVGLLERIEERVPSVFPGPGYRIALLGSTRAWLQGSEYLKVMYQLVAGRPPEVDLRLERAVQQVCRAAARRGLLASAHDCAEGGLAVTLAESCFSPEPVGASVKLPPELGNAAGLFGEGPSRVVVSFAPQAESRLRALCVEHGVGLLLLGWTVAEARLQIRCEDRVLVDEDVGGLMAEWQNALPSLMG